MLKVIESDNAPKMRFEELSVGDVYKDEMGELCIKISADDDEYNCFNIISNKLEDQSEDSIVILCVNAELRV